MIWFAPKSCCHDGKVVPMWWKSRQRELLAGNVFKYIVVSGGSYLVEEGKKAMGIDWMSRDELSQAIPPAYTEFIGRKLLSLAEIESNYGTT